VGLGVVIRNDRGELKVIDIEKIEPTSIEIAEAQASRYGIMLARRLGFDTVMLECDAVNMVKAIQDVGRSYTPIHLIYEDIMLEKSFFRFFDCTHIKRLGNTVAHYVATLDTRGSDEYVCMGPVPQSIVSLAELDVD
ncbi:Plexin-B3, partial [Bienertia sinuspersici]